MLGAVIVMRGLTRKSTSRLQHNGLDTTFIRVKHAGQGERMPKYILGLAMLRVYGVPCDGMAYHVLRK